MEICVEQPADERLFDEFRYEKVESAFADAFADAIRKAITAFLTDGASYADWFE